jgi:hypothetical protein
VILATGFLYVRHGLFEKGERARLPTGTCPKSTQMGFRRSMQDFSPRLDVEDAEPRTSRLTLFLQRVFIADT